MSSPLPPAHSPGLAPDGARSAAAVTASRSEHWPSSAIVSAAVLGRMTLAIAGADRPRGATQAASAAGAPRRLSPPAPFSFRTSARAPALSGDVLAEKLVTPTAAARRPN